METEIETKLIRNRINHIVANFFWSHGKNFCQVVLRIRPEVLYKSLLFPQIIP